MNPKLNQSRATASSPNPTHLAEQGITEDVKSGEIEVSRILALKPDYLLIPYLIFSSGSRSEGYTSPRYKMRGGNTAKILPAIFMVGVVLMEFSAAQFVPSDPDLITFYVYPNKSSPSTREQILFNSTTQQVPKGINPKLPTVIYVHDFYTLPFLVHTNSLINAYLRSSKPVNLVIVDWTWLGNPLGSPVPAYFLGYPLVVFSNMLKVGRRAGEMIAWLVSKKLVSYDKVHLIGFGQGAHICGATGTVIKQSTSGKQKIARITGLDPSGPLHQWPVEVFRLSEEDAEFVDVLHTNIGFLGTTTSLGHVDIIVNSGQLQYPICILNTFLPEPFCSHNFAVNVFSYSVGRDLTACRAFYNEYPWQNGSVVLPTVTPHPITTTRPTHPPGGSSTTKKTPPGHGGENPGGGGGGKPEGGGKGPKAWFNSWYENREDAPPGLEHWFRQHGHGNNGSHETTTDPSTTTPGGPGLPTFPSLPTVPPPVTHHPTPPSSATQPPTGISPRPGICIDPISIGPLTDPKARGIYQVIALVINPL